MNVAGLDPGTYQLDVCVDATCASQSFEVTEQTADELFVSEVYFDLGDADFSNNPWVTVAIADQRGSALLYTETEVEFERWQPNGLLCPPICWLGQVSI